MTSREESMLFSINEFIYFFSTSMTIRFKCKNDFKRGKYVIFYLFIYLFFWYISDNKI